MKTIARLGFLALLLPFTWTACSHDPDVPPKPTPKPDTSAVDSALLGKWYLLGLGWTSEMNTKSLDTIAYALEFWREGFLYGHYVNGSYTLKGTALQIKLNAEDNGPIPLRIRTYHEALLSVERAVIEPDGRMRLYYNQGKQYLLFDKTPPPPPVLNQLPQVLLAEWSFVGYNHSVDKRGTIVPKNLPVQFRFNTDTTWEFKSSTGTAKGSFRTDGWNIRFSVAPGSIGSSGSTYDRDFLETLSKVTNYELVDTELQLLFNGGEEYMSFKKEVVDIPRIDERLCIPWKLVGFGHTADGSLRELSEDDRQANRIFLVDFRDNGTLYTLTSSNELYGSYSVNGPSLLMNVGGGTKVGENEDGKAYVRALNATERFELQKDGRLKLFYNNGRDYLLFREGLSLVSAKPTAELLGTWTLAEIRNYGVPPQVFQPGEQKMTFHADGYVDIEGYQIYHGAPEGRQPFGYRPWGQDRTLFIGWKYYSCEMRDGEMMLGYNTAVDGSLYVFRRMKN